VELKTTLREYDVVFEDGTELTRLLVGGGVDGERVGALDS
jgi:hypothetical protein